MRMWLILFLTCVLIAILGFGIFQNIRTSEAAEGDATVKVLAVKIDQVLANQQTILAKLDELKKELDVVKIRASRK